MRGPSVDARACSTQQNVCVMRCGLEDYQAIAYSPRAKTEGYAYAMETRAAAEAVALDHCRKQARRKGADCQVVGWSFNACVALATAPGGQYGGSWGGGGSIAEARARLECQRRGGATCTVVRTVCPGG